MHVANSTGPLAGIRVLDLTSYLAGPYGCALLGDMGADVIKVEPPGGEMMRRYPSTLPGESRAHLGTNKNKRAVVLNLKRDTGRKALYRLVETADVFVENFRPSVPPRLGIDYETLSRINPRLVYCGLTGYGDEGPMKDAAGFDQVLQSWTGISTFQGADIGGPAVVRGSIVDYYTSALMALGVTAALYRRHERGRGEYLAVSLLRSAVAMQAGRFVWAEGEPRHVDRDLQPGRTAGIHPTAEGHIYISAHSPHFWTALCEILELRELAEDPRYSDMQKRAVHAEELLPRLRHALLRKPAREWAKIMQGRVPCAEVRPIEDLFDDPQVLAEGIVETVPHPLLGTYRTIGKPIKFKLDGAGKTRPAPALGQHSNEILAEIGLSAEEIDQASAG